MRVFYLQKNLIKEPNLRWVHRTDWRIWGVLLFLSATIFLPFSTRAETGPKTPKSSLCITVSDNAMVPGDKIHLSDVASISASNSTLVRQLGGISLGSSPRPGKERRYSRNRLHAKIRGILDSSLQAKIEIPEQVIVKRAFQRASETSLEKAFEAYVANRAGGAETNIRRFKIRGNDPLPLGKITLSPVEQSKRPIKGATTLSMAVNVNGKDMGRLTLTGWVDRYEPVVCASRYVPKGDILTQEDIVLKKINTAKASSRIIRNPEQVIGKQVKSNLRPGRVIQQNIVMLPPMVEKGERVRILAISGGIQVATLGIAMDEGREGEQIKVENIASKKQVVGRVAGRSTVEVLF